MSDRVSIGDSLRAERERREISIDEISQNTRISRHTLHNLEADRYDQLPGDVFVRGYLRAYATTVGFDPEPIVQRFDARRTAGEPKLRVSRPETQRTPFGWQIAFAAAMLFVVLVATFALMGRPPAPQDPIELSSVLCPRHPNIPLHFSSVRSTTATPTASSRC